MELLPKKTTARLPTLTDEDYSCLYGGLQINLPLEKSSNSLTIEIKGFNDFHILWLNKIYRDYEGRIWRKSNSHKRVMYLCLFCNKELVRFHTLRSHLNKHFEIFPFKCSTCEKKYVSNESLVKHRQTKHLE